VVIGRGEVWWADLREPVGSEPSFRLPALVVQVDPLNSSRLQTVLAVLVTSNLRLEAYPGNVLLPSRATGLPLDSVANVSQVITIDKAFLDERVGIVGSSLMERVDAGLRLVLGL
jgi:mRNA interferase MazF